MNSSSDTESARIRERVRRVHVADLEALEAFEMAQDVEAYRTAKAEDDGGRVSLEELRSGLNK